MRGARCCDRAWLPPAAPRLLPPNNGARPPTWPRPAAPATHRLRARGGGSCSASKAPSPPRESGGTGRTKPTSSDDPEAGEAQRAAPCNPTDKMEVAASADERPRGEAANQTTVTRVRPMARGPPPVAEASGGREGGACCAVFEMTLERSMSGAAPPRGGLVPRLPELAAPRKGRQLTPELVAPSRSASFTDPVLGPSVTRQSLTVVKLTRVRLTVCEQLFTSGSLTRLLYEAWQLFALLLTPLFLLGGRGASAASKAGDSTAVPSCALPPRNSSEMASLV